jgi:ferredoxin
MKVKVDITKCSGIGMCEMTAPTVYEVGVDGHSRVLKDEPSADEMAAVREAVADCPTKALSIEDSGPVRGRQVSYDDECH